MDILSPFVAGIGLTIVEANHVLHYGRWWNPAVESQATDRAYRIGQPKEVSVYLPILRDPSGRISHSFDERLDMLMDKKHRLAEDFLRPLPPEEELGGELFTNLREEAKLRS
jgi:SNF2 family DNA or RNA helicase